MDKKIHPIIIYPFRQPQDLRGITELFDKINDLVVKEPDKYLPPVTIVNNQTKYRNSLAFAGGRLGNPGLVNSYQKAIQAIGGKSTITYTWAVDTCAMWLRGFGDAFEQAYAVGNVNDIFWLIPGDFDYSTGAGQQALKTMPKIPNKIFDGEYDICLGEIETDPNSSKHLIDRYGTFGLLYNWFPAEAQGIRARVTDKPRTEFFALSYPVLREALIHHRWYAYEQTLMILLQNMNGSEPGLGIGSVPLSKITDDASGRSSLPSAMQQVERTERALKVYWREKANNNNYINWQDEFRRLDAQSESIRSAAMTILRRTLGP